MKNTITEYGLPRRVLNLDEAKKFVNSNNGVKAIYKTLYKFEEMDGKKPNYNSAIIDKLFFDFDEADCWDEANRLHQYCISKNIQHRIVMSGRGYHLFIICNPYKPENSKGTIYNAQHYFIDMMNLNCDSSVVGDNARICRIPNTYNLKAKLFCVPLTKEDFSKGDKYCKALGKKQNKIRNTEIAKTFFDIKQFDKPVEKDEFEQIDIKDCDINIDINKHPDCIKQILVTKDCNWKQRYLLILYFKESGYTRKEVYDILKMCLSERKFKHCISDERQLQYLFERDDLMFPLCSKIKIDGLCPKKCEKYNKVVYK